MLTHAWWRRDGTDQWIPTSAEAAAASEQQEIRAEQKQFRCPICGQYVSLQRSASNQSAVFLHENEADDADCTEQETLLRQALQTACTPLTYRLHPLKQSFQIEFALPAMDQETYQKALDGRLQIRIQAGNDFERFDLSDEGFRPDEPVFLPLPENWTDPWQTYFLPEQACPESWKQPAPPFHVEGAVFDAETGIFIPECGDLLPGHDYHLLTQQASLPKTDNRYIRVQERKLSNTSWHLFTLTLGAVSEETESFCFTRLHRRLTEDRPRFQPVWPPASGTDDLLVTDSPSVYFLTSPGEDLLVSSRSAQVERMESGLPNTDILCLTRQGPLSSFNYGRFFHPYGSVRLVLPDAAHVASVPAPLVKTADGLALTDTEDGTHLKPGTRLQITSSVNGRVELQDDCGPIATLPLPGGQCVTLPPLRAGMLVNVRQGFDIVRSLYLPSDKTGDLPETDESFETPPENAFPEPDGKAEMEPFSEENEPEPRQKASSQNPTASEPFTEKTVRKSPSSGKKQKPTVDSSQAEIAPDPADTPVDDGLPFTFSFLPTPQAADHPAAKEPIPAQACMDSSSPIPAAPKETFDEVSWIDTLGDFMKELEAPYDGPPHRPFPDFPDFTETREPELSSSSAPDTSNTDQAQTEPLPDIFSACTEPLTIPSHLWRGRSVPFPKRYAHVLCWFRPEYARRLREAFRQGTIPMGVMHYLRQIARAKAEERKHV